MLLEEPFYHKCNKNAGISEGNVFDFIYWWFWTAALASAIPDTLRMKHLFVVLFYLVTVKQDSRHFISCEEGHIKCLLFLFRKIFVLQSLQFYLFSSFTFCHLSLLCVMHCNFGICLSLKHPPPNHAHMSTHAFTDKTFSWRVNTRERRKMTFSNHTEALPVITLCCHWWRRNQSASSSLPRLHRCLP